MEETVSEREGLALSHTAWLSCRMVVMKVVAALLPPPATEPPVPPVMRKSVGQCATREVVAWLLESPVGTGSGVCCGTRVSIVTGDL
jgi:hypothetical protein